MKAISLHQPWASAIAYGLKRIETRSWSTAHRGEIAIHAAAVIPREGARILDRWVASALRSAGWDGEALPFGQIVAIAEIVDVLELPSLLTLKLGPFEHSLGDYADGRFAWRLQNVRRLSMPLSIRGRQRLWNLSSDDAELVRACADVEVPA